MTASSWTRRLGGPADIEGAMDLWDAAQAARRGDDAQAWGRDQLRERLAAPGAWFLVAVGARDGGQASDLLGVAQALPARADDGAGPVLPRVCHVSLVAVRPHAWGRGIGAALLAELLDQAGERGYRRAQLWAHADNSRAQRLYRTAGFVTNGARKVDDLGEEIRHHARDLTLPASGSGSP